MLDGGNAAAGDASAVCAARSGRALKAAWYVDMFEKAFLRTWCVDAGDGGHRGEGVG